MLADSSSSSTAKKGIDIALAFRADVSLLG